MQGIWKGFRALQEKCWWYIRVVVLIAELQGGVGRLTAQDDGSHVGVVGVECPGMWRLEDNL